MKSSPDGVECVEYLDDQIQDTVFHAILKRLYEKFVLLNDKFETMVQEIGLVELRTRLKKCYDIVRGAYVFSMIIIIIICNVTLRI